VDLLHGFRLRHRAVARAAAGSQWETAVEHTLLLSLYFQGLIPVRCWLSEKSETSLGNGHPVLRRDLWDLTRVLSKTHAADTCSGRRYFRERPPTRTKRPPRDFVSISHPIFPSKSAGSTSQSRESGSVYPIAFDPAQITWSVNPACQKGPDVRIGNRFVRKPENAAENGRTRHHGRTEKSPKIQSAQCSRGANTRSGAGRGKRERER